MHLRGVGFDRKVDAQALVIATDRDARTVDREPALCSAVAGEDQVHHGARGGQFRRDGVLVQALDDR